MTKTAVTASLGLRLGWGLRLTAQGLRRHRGAFFASAVAFAIAAAASLVGLAYARAPAAPAGTATGTAQLVAFVDDALPAADRDALVTALGLLPGVSAVRVLPSDEALGRMRAELGSRAAVLDNVEEGFLPTTLEIALGTGREGAGRADELAWRLRRMSGISDVDVLRSEADHRLVDEQEKGARQRRFASGLGASLALAALGLAARALRRRRSDAGVLMGLGFTSTAVSGPACLAGAAAALLGAAGSVALMRLGAHLQLGSLAAPLVGAATWSSNLGVQAATVASVTLLGGWLGWRGARLPRRKVDELAWGA